MQRHTLFMQLCSHWKGVNEMSAETNLQTNALQTNKDLGISRNALSIARMIDRLEEGRYDIVIKKDSIKDLKLMLVRVDYMDILN